MQKPNIRLAIEALIVVVGQAISLASSLILVRFLTSTMDPIHYGNLALYMTFATFANQVIYGGLVNSIARHYPIAVAKKDTCGLLRTADHVMLTVSSFVSVAAAILVLTPTPLISENRSTIAWTTVLTIATAYHSLYTSVCSVARARATVATQTLLLGSLKVALSLIALRYIGSHPSHIIAAFAISSLITDFFYQATYRQLRKRAAPTTNAPHAWLLPIIRFAAPYLAWGPFTWCQQVADRWALETYASTADVGIYTAALQYTFAPITLGTGCVLTFLTPILFTLPRKATAGERPLSSTALIFLLAASGITLTLLLSLTAAINTRIISNILFSNEYKNAAHYIPWLIISAGLFSTGQTLSLKQVVELDVRSQLVPKVATSVLGVLLCFGGAKYGGARGVVYAQVVYSMAFFGAMLILALLPKYGQSAADRISTYPRSSG